MRILPISIVLIFSFNISWGQEGDCSNTNFDHLVFFVQDSSIEQNLNLILTPGENLTTTHLHQGTLSKFYLFYNTFIEFIYPTDTSKIKVNIPSFGSNYQKRWETQKEVCKLGIGMILEPFDSTCSNYHTYYSKDNPGYYLMEKSNRDQTDVLLYYSSIKHSYNKIDSIVDLENFYSPPFLQDFEKYCNHPSGIKSLTKIAIQGPLIESMTNFKQLSGIKLFELKNGKSFKYTLEFDNKLQDQKLVVNDWLTIKY